MDSIQMALTKRCAICRKALVWDSENKWWVCPRCGYTLIAPGPSNVE